MITNEDKANEIVKETSYLPYLSEFEAMQHCALVMAKWKDHKIEEQDNTIRACNSDIKRLKKVNQTHLIEKKNQAKKIKMIVKEHEDLKKDILMLVNLIPRNEENESVINDIKNLLK